MGFSFVFCVFLRTFASTMSLMLTVFLGALLSAGILIVAYFRYVDTREYHLARMPRTVRTMLYPVILFCFAYVYSIFYAISAYWISNIVDWVMNVTVGVIAELLGWSWAEVLWDVIGDVSGAGALVFAFVLPFSYIDFGPEKEYTFFYRLSILIPISILLICIITIKPLGGQEWYDITISVGAILVGAYITYSIMKDDLRGK